MGLKPGKGAESSRQGSGLVPRSSHGLASPLRASRLSVMDANFPWFI
jgi:hypothetical protein